MRGRSLLPVGVKFSPLLISDWSVKLYFFILVSCLCSFAGDFDHYHIQEMIRVKHYFTFLKANLIRLVTHCSKVPFRFRKVVNRSIRELPGFKSLHYVRNIFGTISPVTYNLLVLFLVPKHKRPNLGV